jgi:hypothetical protein
MSDDRAQPFVGLAQWLGEDPDGDAPPDDREPDPHTPSGRAPRRGASRRTARAIALVAPWLVALAALAAPTGRASHQPGPVAPDGRQTSADARPDHGVTPPASEIAAAASVSEIAAAASASETGAPAPSMAADAGPVPPGTAATAVRLVRDAVTGRHGDTTAAVDVAVAEAPRPLGPDQWLVRVQTVVLRGDARRWRSATHETWAVPIGLRSGTPVGLDAPWRVAIDDPVITTAEWGAADVDEDAVRSALRSIGARAAQDMHAQQHPTLTHVVRVRVAEAGRTRRVWLTTHPTVRVLGAPTMAPPTAGATS